MFKCSRSGGSQVSFAPLVVSFQQKITVDAKEQVELGVDSLKQDLQRQRSKSM